MHKTLNIICDKLKPMGKSLFCTNLTAGYNNKTILKNVSFELNQGDFVCLCGPNGAGKSTLLTTLAGLQENKLWIKAEQLPSLKAQVSTTLLSQLSKKEVAQNIAFMQQSEYSTWDFTVGELVLQGRFSHSKNGWYSEQDYQLVEEILNQLELTAFKDRNIHSLSGGEFQKVRIARALAQTPDFMLLDEPAANLDFVYEPQLLDLLKKIAREKNIGILLSIHDVNIAARYADKIALLSPESGLLCDTVENIFTAEKLSEAFGTKLQTYIHPIYNKVQVLYDKE